MSKEVYEKIYEKIKVLEGRCDEGCNNGMSKRFPQGVILAIAIQSFAVIWWAAGIDNSISILQSRTPVSTLEVQNFIAEREKVYMEMDNKRFLEMSTRVTRIEGTFEYIEKSLVRIEKKLMMMGNTK